MRTSQRVSRGFHRLGLFLAVIVLLVGVIACLASPYQEATEEHEKLTCAHKVYLDNPKLFWETAFAPTPLDSSQPPLTISLREIGCSQSADFVLIADAKQPPDFYWWRRFAEEAGPIFVLTVVFAVAIYGLLQAIGWVIGGFPS